jgi:hypothetical protein
MAAKRKQQRIIADLDGLQENVNALPALCSSGRLQSASGEELRPFFGRTLMPSILDRTFKGEL